MIQELNTRLEDQSTSDENLRLMNILNLKLKDILSQNHPFYLDAKFISSQLPCILSLPDSLRGNPLTIANNYAATIGDFKRVDAQRNKYEPRPEVIHDYAELRKFQNDLILSIQIATLHAQLIPTLPLQ